MESSLSDRQKAIFGIAGVIALVLIAVLPILFMPHKDPQTVSDDENLISNNVKNDDDQSQSNRLDVTNLSTTFQNNTAVAPCYEFAIPDGYTPGNDKYAFCGAMITTGTALEDPTIRVQAATFEDLPSSPNGSELAQWIQQMYTGIPITNVSTLRVDGTLAIRVVFNDEATGASEILYALVPPADHSFYYNFDGRSEDTINVYIIEGNWALRVDSATDLIGSANEGIEQIIQTWQWK
jgi:hypothetical protein